MRISIAIAAVLVLVAGVAGATVLVTDQFSYPDGSLVPNGGWANHSGTLGDLLVASGQAVVQHGTPSEDANLGFAATPGTLYFRCHFSVDDLGAPYGGGTDFEYFIHFLEGGTFNYPGRVDIVAPSGAGDFSVGIGTTASTADATWATDLTFGTTYTLVVRYDQVGHQATLWIDPASEASPSISGADLADPGISVDAIALRQSDSTENETIRVNDVVVATDFTEVLNTVPVELQSFSIE